MLQAGLEIDKKNKENEMETQQLIFKRRGISDTIIGGNSYANIEISINKTMVRICRNNVKDEFLRFDTSDEAFDAIDDVLKVKVDRNNAMAYLIKKPLPSGYGEHPNDIYDASVIYSDYSNTFRTPVENYCIASVNDNGTLDFSKCDAAIRDVVMERLNQHEKFSHPEMTLLRSIDSHVKWLLEHHRADHIWTAWLISQYLTGVTGIKQKRMTVKEFQSVYAHYEYGCPVYTTSKVEVA